MKRYLETSAKMNTNNFPVAHRQTVRIFIEYDMDKLLDKHWVYDTLHKIFRSPVRLEHDVVTVELCSITAYPNGFNVELIISKDSMHTHEDNEFLRYYDEQVILYIRDNYKSPNMLCSDKYFCCLEFRIDTTDYILRNGLAYVLEGAFNNDSTFITVKDDRSKEEMMVYFYCTALLYKSNDDLISEVQHKFIQNLTHDEILVHSVHTGQGKLDIDKLNDYIQARCNLSNKSNTEDINRYFGCMDKTEVEKAVTFAKLKNLM